MGKLFIFCSGRRSNEGTWLENILFQFEVYREL